MATYYPIKCTRCAKVMTNDEVLFDVKGSVLGVAGALSGAAEYTAVRPEKTPPAGGNGWGGVQKKDNTRQSANPDGVHGDDLETYLTKHGKGTDKKYLTLGDIRDFCAQRYKEDENGEIITCECRPIYNTVRVTKDFQGYPYDDPNGVLISVSFSKEPGGPLWNANKRACSCGTKLPQSSGLMPTFNVLMMGTTDAGKTVFLCALLKALQKGIKENPEDPKDTKIPVGMLYGRLSSDESNEIKQMSNDMFNNGVLPGTTTAALKEPLILEITYNASLGSASFLKKCILALSDMRGEDFTVDSSERLTQRQELFTKGDAFIFLISPLNIPSILSDLPPEYSKNNSNSAHDVMLSNISGYLLPAFPNGKINAPCAIAMSKADILEKYAGNLNIQYSNSVISRVSAMPFTKTYFKNQQDGTDAILSKDPTLLQDLKLIFTCNYRTSFMSLGRGTEIIMDEKTKKVPNPTLIKPERVLDPIMFILIALNVIPRMDLFEYGKNAENIQYFKKWVVSNWDIPNNPNNQTKSRR